MVTGDDHFDLATGESRVVSVVAEPQRVHRSEVCCTSLKQMAFNWKIVLLNTAYQLHALSALTLLVGRQEGHPACKKQEWWGAGVVVCLEQGADLHMVRLMPLPLTVSCFTKIQIGFTFLVPTHLGSPRKRVVKWVCVLTYCIMEKKFSSTTRVLDFLCIQKTGWLDSVYGFR